MNSKKERKIVIIAPISNLSERVRLNKLTQILFNIDNLNIEFWGWDRKINNDKKDFDFVDKKILVTGGGENNRKLILFYFSWIFKVFFKAFFNNSKKTYFYCLGFESAFPVVLAKFTKKSKMIFDNADNISKSHNWPPLLKKIVTSMENYTATNSNIHLVPGESRVCKNTQNNKVVPNTPASFLLEKARILAAEKNYKRGDVLTIYINGYLTKDRGIDQIYEAIKQIDRKVIKVLVAGYLRCESAKKLVRLDNVEYYGSVSNEESLALYYRSHLCFTFYDPKTEINRFAEPNKWGDCIATGTPFLTNIEIETAQRYLENEACFGVEYYDVNSLVKKLNFLIRNPYIIKQSTEKMKKIEFKPWDEAVSQLLEEFFSEENIKECDLKNV